MPRNGSKHRYSFAPNKLKLTLTLWRRWGPLPYYVIVFVIQTGSGFIANKYKAEVARKLANTVQIVAVSTQHAAVSWRNLLNASDGWKKQFFHDGEIENQTQTRKGEGSVPCRNQSHKSVKIPVFRGAETRGGMGGIYPPNNLTVSPPIIWVWPTSCIPPIILLLCASERRFPLEFGEKSVPHLVKTYFFWSSPELGEKKCSIFWWRPMFFFGLHLICSPEQNCGWGSSSPMSKIGRNCGKIANYPPPMRNKDRHPCLCRKICLLFLLNLCSSWLEKQKQTIF